MADYGLDGSDHSKRKYELKLSTYEKRSKVASWQIIVSMGLIMTDISLDGSEH